MVGAQDGRVISSGKKIDCDHRQFEVPWTDFDVEPGWTMAVDGALIAQIKILRSNETAIALRGRILEYLASEEKPELSDIRIVRGPGDFDPAMSGYAIAFLRSWFSRG